MEPILMMYIILAGFMCFVFGVAILIIAGKDIYLAFARKFLYKWNEVYIVNANRQIAHHYLKPDNGKFKVNNSLYFCNPDKLLNLTEKQKQDIDAELKRNLKKTNERIAQYKRKISEIEEAILKEEDQDLRKQLREQANNLALGVNSLESKLARKEQKYYFRNRPAYFFIENDPIPKDFHEFYSMLDSIAVENEILRAMTKDPKSLKELEAHIKQIRLLCFGIAIGVAVVCYFVIKNNSMLTDMAKGLGVVVHV